MPCCSFTEALESKYGDDDIENFTEEKIFLVGNFSRLSRQNGKLRVPRTLTLNGCGINEAGSVGTIQELCQKVEELDLAQNDLDDLTEVCKIVGQMPRLWFLNLSHNDLAGAISEVLETPCPHIRNLVLNHTSIPWPALNSLLDAMPNVQELHLSLNGYSDVGLRPGCSYPGVERVYMSGNPHVKEWSSLVSLGQAFPQLRSLVAASTGLSTVPDPYGTSNWTRHLDNLASLSLNHTALSRWTDIDNLNGLPSLQDARLQGLPLLNPEHCHLNEKERRQHLIARLPKLSTLNGSTITNKEREEAERAFIRYFMDKSDRPSRVTELEEKHGKLEPLANVDLSPKRTAKVDICWGGQREQRTIHLHSTVRELKALISRLLGLPPARLRVFYVDMELSRIRDVLTADELRFLHKQLYTYHVQDGDQFLVQEK